ncbi:unnamed protein product [Phaedon cochleariae]|uniref:Peroxisomal biogenesis factor 3 n=1 Tax=Phaedon cochleariae TaxID=80249 RepID=A0A9P0GXH8_PHACE|nr:unnamed protein product [Phaedon cochleariae]
MSLVSKFRGFLWRHKNKLIFGSAFIAGSVYLTKYAQRRLKEWQDKEATEFFDRNRKYSHFQSIGQTSNQTVSNLSIALLDIINETVDTDEVIEALKKNPEKKLEMWNTLKVLVFTKAAVIIYSMVMLVVTLKIQLSLIGGHLYKNPNSVSTDMQEKYLSLCKNFLNDGVKKLTNIATIEMTKCVENLELSKQLKLSDIEAIYWSIQTALATHVDSPVENFKDYILPDNSASSSSIYDQLLRDTADFLDSDEVKSLSTHCINRGFILLGDQVAEFYNQSSMVTSTNNQQESFQNPFEMKKPLAKLIPIINGLLSKQSLPQHFVQQLITNEKLQILSANIYESLM